MSKSGSILVVDNNKAILSALKVILPTYFEEVRMLVSPNTLVSTITAAFYDVVLLDMNFSAGLNSCNEGFYWLSEIKKHSPYSEVVLFTAYADIDIAVNAIKQGAFDFIVKPWNNAKLVATLSAAYELSKSKREVKQLKEIKNEIRQDSEMFWGQSSCMQELHTLIEKVSVTDANILITGENGTGKDMLAREIHKLSRRRHESMVTVDIGSLTESLFESELFGHVKGAFTDAKVDRAGKFEVASGGTLLLDEIGNIPLHLQSKLLTAIQSRTITRVGSNKIIPIDIRMICATNKDLSKMVTENLFREDLLYRINTIHITIPPLRDRKEDIIPLALIFLSKYSKKYGKNIENIDTKASTMLESYHWSGNIRELQHSIEKAVILAESGELTDRDLFLVQKDFKVEANDAAVFTLEDIEKEAIKAALTKHNWNLSAVAQQLDITRQTLYNKLKKYNL